MGPKGPEEWTETPGICCQWRPLRGRVEGQHAKCGTMIDFGRDEAPAPTQFPIPQVKIVDPDGVLEEALAMFKKKEEPSDTGTRRPRRGKTRRLMPETTRTSGESQVRIFQLLKPVELPLEE
uniref:MORN repeat containing 3 n=1 Tax=Myotis myotis TaxID=51298 RepID=A0A7J7S291_MYOMY|nr:MORN repeat containing 3 [Myotis myotis]